MNRDWVRWTIGGLSVGCSLWYAVCVMVDLGDDFQGTWMDWLSLVLCGIVVAPAMVLLFCGVQLMRKMSVMALRWSMGMLCLAFCCCVFSWVNEMGRATIDGKFWDPLCFFFGCVFAVPMYFMIMRRLLRFLSGDEVARDFRIDPGILLMLALVLWSMLSGFLRAYWPDDSPSESRYLMVKVLAPIFGSWLFHRIALQVGIRKQWVAAKGQEIRIGKRSVILG